MNKIFLGLLITVVLISCDKNTVQQTTDSIKSTDSLFTKANEGLKTLDSISKTINDSAGFTRKVIIPEIEKQKKIIDSTIKTGGYQIDSINKEIKKITTRVIVGTEVVKTLDSANESIKNGESAIKVLTRTADKIFNQTKRQKSSESNSARYQNQNNTVVDPAVVEKRALIKTAKIEIEVDDLQSAKEILREKIKKYNADLISENFSDTEGLQREYLKVKVPLRNFDQLITNIASQTGNLKTKDIVSQGTEYVSGQMSDVEITLVQNDNSASNPITTDNEVKDSDSFKSKSSNAFLDGFTVLGTVIIAIIPFWPLFLIAALIWYFVRRNKRNKEKKINENLRPISTREPFQKEIKNTEPIELNKTENIETPDYSKYLPKD